MGRWQRFISHFFPPEATLRVHVDAADDGSSLALQLALHAPETETPEVLGLDIVRGQVRTTEGQRRLTPESRRLVTALRPSLLRGATMVVEEQRVPETLQTLRSHANAVQANGADIIESPNARAIKLADRRPLAYEFQVEFADPESLAVTPQIVSPDGKVRLDPGSLQPSDRWVRQEQTYYPVPAPTPEAIAAFTAQRVLLRGDAIPFFLAKQIKQLARHGRVQSSNEVKQARVAGDVLEPVSILDLDEEGFIRVGVAYRSEDLTMTQAEVAELPDDAKYARRNLLWVPIDRVAERKLAEALAQVEHRLSAKRDSNGWLRLAPDKGDEARRILLGVTEIDEGNAFKKFLADLAGFKQIDPIEPPLEVTATLRQYQIEGFRWLVFLRKYFLNGVLADDMGLGKSLSCLALLQYAKLHPDAQTPDPVLIVCPTSCVDNWLDEAAKFTPELQLQRYASGTRLGAESGARPDIYVTTYETLRRDMGTLMRQPWDYVILDEAQKVKNPITDTARACRQLLARHRLAVTGTPIENRLDELWAIFDFLMPGYLGSQPRFRREFEAPIMREKSVIAADALKRKIAPFILRRMKEQVARDLPPKLYVTRECQLTHEQSVLYAQAAGEGRERVLAATRDVGDNVHLTMSILSSLTKLKQICCHPALLDANLSTANLHGRSGKFETFKQELAERLEVGDKVLIFSQYAEMCRLIDRYLREQGIPALYLDGQTRNRQELVRSFQADPTLKVFVLSLRAAGFGITLTAASSVMHFDRWWNPAVENQATDRAYRIGQKRSVQVVQFQTADTIEEKIDKLLTSKAQLFGDVIETDIGSKSISRDELLDLFTFSPLQESATGDGLSLVVPSPAG